MGNWKDIGKRLLYPGKWITGLVCLAGFGLLGVVFYRGMEETPLAYAVYVLAFYALVVLTAGSIPLVRKGISLYRQRKEAHSPQLRGRLMLSLSINVCFGGYNLISGAVYRSVWLMSTGVYYMVLSLIRMVLVHYERKQAQTEVSGEKYRIGWQGFQVCGVLMVLLNIAMSGMVVQMIRYGRGSRYPELVVYAVAAYTFYRLTAAIIRVVQSRGNRDPIRGAARNINLTAAMMSLYSLQTAMLNVFGDDPEFQVLMNSLSGGAVCFLVVLGALGMALHGGKRKREVLS